MRHAIHHPPAARGRARRRRRAPAVRVAAPVVLVVGGLVTVAAIASFVLMLVLMVGVPIALGAAAFVAVRHARRAARHGGLHAGPPAPVAVAPPRPVPDWSRARRRFDALRAEYAAHECDAMSVLRLPALSDVAVPSTGRFVEAFAEAQALETEERPADAHAASFAAAVDRAERAWRAAVDAAERIRLSGLSPAERATVERVIKLLTTARDSDSDAERLAAYSRARSELARLDRAGVVHLPRPAAAALDAAARGALPG